MKNYETDGGSWGNQCDVCTISSWKIEDDKWVEFETNDIRSKSLIFYKISYSGVLTKELEDLLIKTKENIINLSNKLGHNVEEL